MKIILHRDEFVQTLMKALGIPGNCREFEVRVSVKEFVTVKCLLIPESPKEEPTWKQYKLYEIEEKDANR